MERNADPLEKKIYYAWLREVRDERGDETGKHMEMQECAEDPETYSWLNYDSGRELIDVEGVPVPQDMLTRLLKCLQGIGGRLSRIGRRWNLSIIWF